MPGMRAWTSREKAEASPGSTSATLIVCHVFAAGRCLRLSRQVQEIRKVELDLANHRAQPRGIRRRLVHARHAELLDAAARRPNR